MKRQKKSIVGFISLAVSAVMLVLSVAMLAASAEPGAADDPLVTKSYLETVLESLKNENAAEQAPTQSGFKLISMKNGQKLICYEGTEFILRQGGGTIYSQSGSGMANVTAGMDLPSGVSVPANHHMVCPVSQERYMLAFGDVLVLVKGEYKIEG